MRVFTSIADVPAGFGPSAVTIGKFDGVHMGHRAVIDELKRMADAEQLVPTVVTFDRNPLSLLRPELCPEPLVSNAQKLELLEEAGVEATLMLTFDESLREQTPDEFVSRVLVDALRARIVFVGGDFRYGVKGSGDIDTLRAEGARFGFDVRLVDDVREAGRRASSTWTREALAAGDVRRASELLGHLPTLRSVVVAGEKRGRELGFPTANLRPDVEGFIPADGVYAGWLTIAGDQEGEGVPMPAAISIGNNPTFDGVPERQVEAFVLDQDFDLYGRTVEIAFVDRIRDMLKFTTIEALIDTLHEDVRRTREIMASAPRPSR
ncbi:bifunctional riboflavin kinase/FAD synthetase [Ruicaihuangia caeni]|uniref:Riboflavin biosynthesis protein n=1 Tax=Ruicaihuangia caeni TaxID=3042517 RepID=A0AAW6T112_9MICO|nr:bifunctional riboflavin kinase/FAD synthetase [Klugiella sp. YN-L-19]MDI2097520.1 bifunctional riboflavin kinase/FAD synthetase [Klugiella sp. YN-L-19]